ncbi:hypothetical protein GQ602_002870 [Ophiocordyceps camponoti-floridani]|uniref:Uncharacterized protein n=1 Tax=Ophiocordyceps camponoti-floridani TaxID=2030778 RepID=A0A8H4VFT6_9HYPO|nr:hypothetical protein GQ602_002870 [Ophiocordyceps camponoti-floridani]
MGERLETADEYGRRSRCFQNHRKSPFRYKHLLADIQASALETAPDGFVQQSGLGSCCFPEPSESWEESIEPSEQSLKHLSWPQSQPWRLSSVKDLHVPVEELDLGTLPELDVQQSLRDVSEMRACLLFRAWLPLSAVDDERDEGLSFPLKSAKMQSLLHRKLEIETMAPFSEVGHGLKQVGGPCLSLLSRVSSRFNVENVTPPLSPISDTPSPFIPGSDCAGIDLASEPDSPRAPESPRDQIDGAMGPMNLEFLVEAAAEPRGSRFGDELEPSHPSLQDVALELPLIMTSSDAVLEAGVADDIHLTHSVVDLVGPPSSISLGKESGLDEVLASILTGREMDPTTMAEQEQLNPTDSVTRVPVPVLDFRLPKAGWMGKNWEARGHFVWLQASSPETYQIPLLPIDRRLNRSLRWAPFPAESSARLMVEELELPRESQSILEVDKIRHPGSVRYVLLPQIITILDMGEDMELQEIPAEGLTGIDEAANGSDGVFHPCVSSKAQPARSAARHETARLNSCLLPDASDPNATAGLLSGFMELRAVKRRRLSPGEGGEPDGR